MVDGVQKVVDSFAFKTVSEELNKIRVNMKGKFSSWPEMYLEPPTKLDALETLSEYRTPEEDRAFVPAGTWDKVYGDKETMKLHWRDSVFDLVHGNLLGTQTTFESISPVSIAKFPF